MPPVAGPAPAQITRSKCKNASARHADGKPRLADADWPHRGHLIVQERARELLRAMKALKSTQEKARRKWNQCTGRNEGDGLISKRLGRSLRPKIRELDVAGVDLPRRS